jgi:hypothetical protein
MMGGNVGELAEADLMTVLTKPFGSRGTELRSARDFQVSRFRLKLGTRGLSGTGNSMGIMVLSFTYRGAP